MNVLYSLLMIGLSAIFSFSLIKGGCIPTKLWYWICEACLVAIVVIAMLRGAMI